MLTSKGKYGLKALVHLAGLPPGVTAQSFEIASANRISKKFLDTILGELRVGGFIQSKKGKAGGYRLARAGSEISVGAVIRLLDGPLAPIYCASRFSYRPCEDCPDIEGCSVRLTMLEVRDEIARVLDNTTVADMREKALSERPALLAET